MRLAAKLGQLGTLLQAPIGAALQAAPGAAARGGSSRLGAPRAARRRSGHAAASSAPEKGDPLPDHTVTLQVATSVGSLVPSCMRHQGLPSQRPSTQSRSLATAFVALDA